VAYTSLGQGVGVTVSAIGDVDVRLFTGMLLYGVAPGLHQGAYPLSRQGKGMLVVLK